MFFIEALSLNSEEKGEVGNNPVSNSNPAALEEK